MLGDRAVVILLVACVLMVPACTAPAASQSQPPADVVSSRKVLGDPMVALAQAALLLAQDLDALRHEVDRGDGMRRNLAVVEKDIQQVRRAARTVLAASQEAPVAEAATIASEGVTDALAAASAAQAELRYLRAVARIDRALLTVVASWDRPGSQSEQRERLAAQVDRVRALREKLRAAAPQPPACRTLLDNRRRWIGVVRKRTEALRASADSSGGERYDELRNAYGREPFAEDPMTADAKDRDCWTQRSDVWGTGRDLRVRVDRLQQVLA